MSGFASLIFLSYKRPQFIFEAIQSAVENAGYPCEVIVVDDGSDAQVTQGLHGEMTNGHISKLVMHRQGHNEGVGQGIYEGFSIAQGDPVIKLDQDMLYHENWLAKTVEILERDPRVGMFGFFKYHHPPVPWEEMRIYAPTAGEYHYTRQFCGSGFAIPRSVLESLGPLDVHLDAFNEDSNYMQRVRDAGLELALPDTDLADNRGFGIGPSTVVEEGYVVHAIHHGPHVVNANPCTPQTDVISPEPIEEDDVRWKWGWTHDFRVGVVITTCAGREENLQRTLRHLGELRDTRPELIVVVYDGCPVEHEIRAYAVDIPIWRVKIDKHGPGQEQPRNVGFNAAREVMPDLTHVWFLDSDLIVPSDTLAQFHRGLCAADEDRILIGPYDWLPPGKAEFAPEMRDMAPGAWTPNGMADYRWEMFKEHGPEVVHRHSLGPALGCFGGNLIYPVDMFEAIGGFHKDLHHGRCEDGELGLRACEAGLPMSCVGDARAWHVWHDTDYNATIGKNARDVPLLNAMHPWVEQEGLRVVDVDGKSFDWRCPDCHEVHNTLSFWTHAQTHRGDYA